MDHSRCLARVNTFVYGGSVDDRLTKSDWIEHGLRTLARDGANALKVGPMATQLKVSRGSFYWHFGRSARQNRLFATSMLRKLNQTV
jgi:AcrR family transcriptional regulator